MHPGNSADIIAGDGFAGNIMGAEIQDSVMELQPAGSVVMDGIGMRHQLHRPRSQPGLLE